MINPEDITEQELETLKGDAVGDSLCSSKWIINTLMSLCEVTCDVTTALVIVYLDYLIRNTQ